MGDDDNVIFLRPDRKKPKTESLADLCSAQELARRREKKRSRICTPRAPLLAAPRATHLLIPEPIEVFWVRAIVLIKWGIDEWGHPTLTFADIPAPFDMRDAPDLCRAFPGYRQNEYGKEDPRSWHKFTENPSAQPPYGWDFNVVATTQFIWLCNTALDPEVQKKIRRLRAQGRLFHARDLRYKRSWAYRM